MDEVTLHNKRCVYDLNSNRPHTGEYFQVVEVAGKYHLYYADIDSIKMVASDSFIFSDNPKTVMQNSPGGCFCILGSPLSQFRKGKIQSPNHRCFCIINKDKLHMLCGAHKSAGEGEQEIPDLVWPNEKKTISDWTESREDRKNGMYLLNSTDGVEWTQVTSLPVLHSHVSSETVMIGEIGFDTSPSVIKLGDEFIYYGRLNSSLDERRIYARKSKDLIEWDEPKKISIRGENTNKLKKNYYNSVVFSYNNCMYMFAPYFEACGTTKRVCQNGRTIILRSSDGLSWDTIGHCLPHSGKYKDRINSVIVKGDVATLFYREGIVSTQQKIVSYDLDLKDLQ
jgi:hypothetical protein